MREIPILLYQNIGNYPENMMEDGLLPETFERQMNFLAENGYSVVTLDQVLDHMNRHVRLSPKSIALTIDGGYQDAFTNGLPVLEKYGFHPGDHLFSPTCGHLFFPHPLCHLAGMKKRRDQYIQMVIRRPGVKSDS